MHDDELEVTPETVRALVGEQFPQWRSLPVSPVESPGTADLRRPTGLYPNPSCRSCARPMFHVVTVESGIREDGDGFRGLLLCEDCHTVSCNATSWN